MARPKKYKNGAGLHVKMELSVRERYMKLCGIRGLTATAEVVNFIKGEIEQYNYQVRSRRRDFEGETV